MHDKISIILRSLTVVILLGICIVGNIGNRKDRNAQKCTGIEVIIADSARFHFLNDRQVVRILDRDFGGYVNRPRDSIYLAKVENTLMKQEEIENAEAFFGNDGILHVTVRQSTPVAKMKVNDICCYMNSSGELFTVNEDRIESLPLIEGKFRKWDKLWTARFGAMAAWVANEKGWRNRVACLNCLDNGEVEIRLNGHEEIFVFGQPVSTAAKFARIETYFNKILPEKAEGMNYQTINVKFEKQIVCK